MTPLQNLIFDAITFADLAAGEGIGIDNPKTGVTLFPEDFLMEYSQVTDDLDWDTLATSIVDRIQELEEIEWQYKDLCK